MLTTESALRKDKRTGIADLQHRHFTTIATIISELPTATRTKVAMHFADRLRPTNQNFDRARFLSACGEKV